MTAYSLIAGIADNRVIGKDNRIPWHYPEDLKLFKRLTTGNILIMGRKTFESIGKILPGRTNIVITRNPGTLLKQYVQDKLSKNLIAADSLANALNKAEAIAEGRSVFISGGASIYEQAITGAERLYLSRIPLSPEGDTFFPDFSTGWELESAEEFSGFRLEIYKKADKV